MPGWSAMKNFMLSYFSTVSSGHKRLVYLIKIWSYLGQGEKGGRESRGRSAFLSAVWPLKAEEKDWDASSSWVDSQFFLVWTHAGQSKEKREGGCICYKSGNTLLRRWFKECTHIIRIIGDTSRLWPAKTVLKQLNMKFFIALQPGLDRDWTLNSSTLSTCT